MTEPPPALVCRGRLCRSLGADHLRSLISLARRCGWRAPRAWARTGCSLRTPDRTCVHETDRNRHPNRAAEPARQSGRSDAPASREGTRLLPLSPSAKRGDDRRRAARGAAGQSASLSAARVSGWRSPRGRARPGILRSLGSGWPVAGTAPGLHRRRRRPASTCGARPGRQVSSIRTSTSGRGWLTWRQREAPPTGRRARPDLSDLARLGVAAASARPAQFVLTG
jgi:hypothetical protein